LESIVRLFLYINVSFLGLFLHTKVSFDISIVPAGPRSTNYFTHTHTHTHTSTSTHRHPALHDRKSHLESCVGLFLYIYVSFLGLFSYMEVSLEQHSTSERVSRTHLYGSFIGLFSYICVSFLGLFLHTKVSFDISIVPAGPRSTNYFTDTDTHTHTSTSTHRHPALHDRESHLESFVGLFSYIYVSFLGLFSHMKVSFEQHSTSERVGRTRL